MCGDVQSGCGDGQEVDVCFLKVSLLFLLLAKDESCVRHGALIKGNPYV